MQRISLEGNKLHIKGTILIQVAAQRLHDLQDLWHCQKQLNLYECYNRTYFLLFLQFYIIYSAGH